LTLMVGVPEPPFCEEEWWLWSRRRRPRPAWSLSGMTMLTASPTATSTAGGVEGDLDLTSVRVT